MITIEDVKRYLNIEDSEVKNDRFIESCIDLTFSDIENYCRQNITETTKTVNYDIVGNSVLFNEFPINSISSIEIYDNDLNLLETLSNTDYTLFKTSSLYYCIFNNSYDGYIAKIAFSCGYSVIPSDIKKVHLEMTAIMYKESDVQGGLKGGRLGLTSVNENISQVSNSTNFSVPIDRWSKILNKYRMPLG